MDHKMRNQLEAAITKHGDCCAICKKPYQNMTHTYTGVAADGRMIVTCDDCKGHLSVCYAMGLYVPKSVTPNALKTLFESHPMSTQVNKFP